jgi:4-hydroxythreonine-4-phosphate dehydrogenase
MKPPIAVSLGCPCGIGPEVAVVAAASSRERVVLVGDVGVVLRAAVLRGVERRRFVEVASTQAASGLGRGQIGVIQPTTPLAPGDVRYGKPARAAGSAQLEWVDAGCDLAARGEVRALVTGPVSKDAIARSGAASASRFIGHTEHLQRRLGAGEVIMAFWTEALTVALVTTHIALRDVPRAVTRERVASSAFWLTHLLSGLRGRGRRRPCIAVAGLNPHAGEHGLFGDEEARVLVPGISLARSRLRRRGLDATLVGPVPAETAFRLATRCYDGVVALYHDQATIPMKLLGFGEAVNVSLGLPIVRTSVDHGTAYDVAGRGVADARGMSSAIDLAARLTRSGRRRVSG